MSAGSTGSSSGTAVIFTVSATQGTIAITKTAKLAITISNKRS